MAKTQSHITFGHALHLLQIGGSDFRILLDTHNIPTVDTDFGPGISYSDLMRLVHLPEIPDLTRKARLAACIRVEQDSLPPAKDAFERDMGRMLSEYSSQLDVLVGIHSKYDSKILPILSETAETASYSLLARALSLMRLAVSGLRQRHFDTIVLLRLIDEAINLSEYFLIEKDSSEGKQALVAWFRTNYSPKQSDCRTSIDRWFSQMPISKGLPSFGSIMKDLYEGKSKPVHNTHHSIFETYHCVRHGNLLSGAGFDYGYSRDLRKLHQLIEFA
jgi:hypothetical protein